MYNEKSRQRKATTMVAVLEDYIQPALKHLSLLNVGGSSGIIDNYFSDHFASVISIDIDEPAVNHAKEKFQKDNLTFQVGDALNLQFADNSFDVVICSHIYEHVPAPDKMLEEIFRVLKPAGVCFFAAGNRIMWNEPHYQLPLLSFIPRRLAHIYIKLAKKADHYHELHFTYWGLKKLVRQFELKDYTAKIINNPAKYHTEYMVPQGSMKSVIDKFMAINLIWLIPSYIWLLQKPDN